MTQHGCASSPSRSVSTTATMQSSANSRCFHQMDPFGDDAKGGEQRIDFRKLIIILARLRRVLPLTRLAALCDSRSMTASSLYSVNANQPTHTL